MPIYRSSLVFSYKASAKHKRYVEYRVWAYSKSKGSYPKALLKRWLKKLFNKYPSNVLGRRMIKRFTYYEKDEKVDMDEIRLGTAKENMERGIEKIYGMAVFGKHYYLAEQKGQKFEEIARGSGYRVSREKMESQRLLEEFYKEEELRKKLKWLSWKFEKM